MRNLKEKQKGDWILLGVVLIIVIILLSIFPDRKEQVINTLWDYFVEVMLILPAIMIILGLFAVWTSKEMVIKKSIWNKRNFPCCNPWSSLYCLSNGFNLT